MLPLNSGGLRTLVRDYRPCLLEIIVFCCSIIGSFFMHTQEPKLYMRYLYGLCKCIHSISKTCHKQLLTKIYIFWFLFSLYSSEPIRIGMNTHEVYSIVNDFVVLGILVDILRAWSAYVSCDIVIGSFVDCFCSRLFPARLMRWWWQSGFWF